ncbi:MAG TPA: 16S rRNA (guanine(966)-N(2))-methyltransferase RsmD [Pseudonocardia sp.]|jgi:16S rRNA (guanine966-N2)-methyltransferase|nr:16S rRNA (guanine(966)-N(2))-methyltransferase RsmD [Pseudonocardia sp.]
MTRIIAGTLGGRRLAVPPSGTRPTSDRVREALFSSLASDPGLMDASVLDLYAGSGALGLEALSRGAATALFVESDRRAAATLKRNIGELGLRSHAVVRVGPVGSVLAGPASTPYGIVLADPPYATPNEEITAWLRLGAVNGWFTEDATVVVERPSRAGGLDWPAPLRPERDRRYGDTVLHVALCYGS